MWRFNDADTVYRKLVDFLFNFFDIPYRYFTQNRKKSIVTLFRDKMAFFISLSSFQGAILYECISQKGLFLYLHF